MKAIGIKLINAFPEEIKSHDYNVKGFFFIGKPGKSANPDNKDRTVYQINYRWPALHTFPPDKYKNLGFWMLMDDEWQERREKILFDITPD